MPTIKKTVTAVVLAATALLSSACGHTYSHSYYPATRHVVVHRTVVHHVVVHHVVTHHVVVHHVYHH